MGWLLIAGWLLPQVPGKLPGSVFEGPGTHRAVPYYLWGGGPGPCSRDLRPAFCCCRSWAPGRAGLCARRALVLPTLSLHRSACQAQSVSRGTRIQRWPERVPSAPWPGRWATTHVQEDPLSPCSPPGPPPHPGRQCLIVDDPPNSPGGTARRPSISGAPGSTSPGVSGGPVRGPHLAGDRVRLTPAGPHWTRNSLRAELSLRALHSLAAPP